jgi:hypothetical protein
MNGFVLVFFLLGKGETALWLNFFSLFLFLCRRFLSFFLSFSQGVELANEQSVFFSQEMASSASRNINGIPLATLLEWYKIRDTFFGRNEVFRSIPLALELASSCRHPDAQWLAEACARKDVRREKSFFFSWPKRRALAVFRVAVF